LEEVKRTVRTLQGIDQQMKSMLEEISAAPYLLSIPGIGVLSAAVFLGELGDPAHFIMLARSSSTPDTILRRAIQAPG